MSRDPKYYEFLYKNKGLSSTNSYASVSSANDFSVTYMDTAKVEEIKEELVKLADEYNDIIAKLFQRLGNVPNTTKEWVGNQANYYFNTISPDKTKFLSFSNNLRDIANKLDNDIALVTGNVNKLVRLEEEARYNDQI